MPAARLAIVNGWLTVPYNGPDAVAIHIAVVTPGADPDWQPAFLDYHDGQRVAQIRPPLTAPVRARVLLRVGSSTTIAGTYPAT